MDDLDDLEAFGAIMRGDYLHDDRRGRSPKAQAAFEANAQAGRAQAQAPFRRWSRRVSPPITLPKLKFMDGE